MTYLLGGFDQTYKSFDDMCQAMAKHQTLPTEFKACLEKLIAYLNIGKINLRLRGKKKTQLIAAMLEERQKAVRLVKSEGLKSIIPFRAQPLEKYMKDHPNADPKKRRGTNQARSNAWERPG